MIKLYKPGRFIGSNGIGANSATLYDGELVSKTGGFILKTTAGVNIEGQKAGEQTFASDNQTVAQAKAEYIEQDEHMEFEVDAVGATIVFAGDLVTGNTINMKVNGVAITEVTFDTSHAATMALLDTELTSFDEIESVVVGGDNNRTLYIKPTGLNTDIVITDIVVAAGAGQTTGTYSEQTLAVTDEGKFYDLVSGSQHIDIATAHATSGQVKLKKAKAANRGIVTVANT